jgi:hypothetical protein
VAREQAETVEDQTAVAVTDTRSDAISERANMNDS